MSETRSPWTDQELSAWLEEQLPPERMVRLEKELRSDEALRHRLAQIIRHRDQGGHTVGDIWRRARLSCPTRSELGGYLLETLPQEAADYIEFHLMTIGCRMCQASLQDLQEHLEQPDAPRHRRRRIFESSAGYLGHGSSPPS